MALLRIHLRLALRAAKAIPDPLAATVQANLGAYCSGAVAPDARGNRAVPRDHTHFYEFAERASWGLATRRFVQDYASLGRIGGLDAGQAAYAAGYLSHLAVDEVFVASLGRFAEEQAGHAIRAFTWTIETDWNRRPRELVSAQAALGDPPAVPELVVRRDHLHAMLPHVRLAAAACTPAEYQAVLARSSGREESPLASASAVSRNLATARDIFVPEAAPAFARLALAELRRRLSAYAGGEAASYDAPELRDPSYSSRFLLPASGDS